MPEDEELSPFARRVKELRERKGWSQAQLADRVGTSKMRVYRIEKDEVPAKLDLVEDLARAFGLRAIEFLAPILDSRGDAKLLEQAQTKRLETEIAAQQLALRDRFLEAGSRDSLARFIEEATRAGALMDDQVLDFLQHMLQAWRLEFGMAEWNLKQHPLDTAVHRYLEQRLARDRSRRTTIRRKK